MNPDLTPRRIITFWAVVFAFVLFSGICWTAFVCFLMWVTG